MSRRKHAKRRNQPPSKQGSARWRKRRALGQNFLRDARDAERIVAAARIGSEDLVLEFGPGSGMLTTPLSRCAGKVIAVEKDPEFSRVLRDLFDETSVEVITRDARDFRLPKQPFKVVSNIPFGVTTDILDLLLQDPSRGPVSGSLLVQDDVARKHTRRSSTPLKTLSWSPWYELSSGLKLPSGAFYPRPEVDARVLNLKRRNEYLLPPASKRSFEKFVSNAYRYGTPNGVGIPLRKHLPKKRLLRLARELGFRLDTPPSRLRVEQWVGVFRELREP